MGIHGPRAQEALGDRLVVDPRAAARRGGEAARGRRAAVVGADARPGRDGRRARRRIGHGHGGLRRRDLSPGRAVGCGADDARRPGRCGDRRQDGDRHPAGQEPRRRVPLAGARRDRRGAARDAARARAPPGARRAREDALLAGAELDVRGAAAYKAALCLRDPHDRGVRQWLNLGHTFAHALEAAAGFELAHGDAVALGLLAALRLSGRDTAPRRRRARPGPGRGRPRARMGRRCSATRSAPATRSISSCSARTGRGRSAPRGRGPGRAGYPHRLTCRSSS